MTERASGVGPVAAVQPVAPTPTVATIKADTTEPGAELRAARNMLRDARPISGSCSQTDQHLSVSEARAHMPATSLASDVPLATISATARWLSQLLGNPSIANTPPPALHPLLPAVVQRSADIAAALQSDIGRSGLFYESHLTEWIAGERDIDTLRQEPQAHLHGQTRLSDEQGDAAQLVRRQLALLDSGQVCWRGELWPGLPLAVQIAAEIATDITDDEDAPTRDASAAGSDPRTWQATIVSTLPRLGEISVRLRITDNHVDLLLHAPVADGAALLLSHSASLAHAMQRAGLLLRVVQQDG